MTFTSTLRAIFVLVSKKIIYNLKATGPILIQFYAIVYLTSFYKSNISEHI